MNLMGYQGNILGWMVSKIWSWVLLVFFQGESKGAWLRDHSPPSSPNMTLLNLIKAYFLFEMALKNHGWSTSPLNITPL